MKTIIDTRTSNNPATDPVSCTQLQIGTAVSPYALLFEPEHDGTVSLRYPEPADPNTGDHEPEDFESVAVHAGKPFVMVWPDNHRPFAIKCSASNSFRGRILALDRGEVDSVLDSIAPPHTPRP